MHIYIYMIYVMCIALCTCIFILHMYTNMYMNIYRYECLHAVMCPINEILCMSAACKIKPSDS